MMKKDEYRKVLWVDTIIEGYNKNFLSPKEEHKPKEPKKGYFHEWAQCGDQEGGFEKFALVEDDKGVIHEVDTYRIKFVDKI